MTAKDDVEMYCDMWCLDLLLGRVGDQGPKVFLNPPLLPNITTQHIAPPSAQTTYPPDVPNETQKWTEKISKNTYNTEDSPVITDLSPDSAQKLVF